MQSKNDAQQVKLTVATGAAVDTNIAIPGITARDAINAVVSRVASVGGSYLINKPTLSAGSTDTNIASTAFQFAINGVPEAKAAVTAGTALSAADTINTGAATGSFWGAWLVQITTGGTISTKPAGGLSDQVYATEAAAIAALPDPDAANVAMGYVTIQTNADSAWTGQTDDMVAESDCADINFYSMNDVSDLNATLAASAFAVTADGYIQSSTLDTTGRDLFVVWVDFSEG